jgi:hypothetical protein
MRGGEHREEQPAEQAREHPDGQEEAWPAGDPARAVGGQAAARHDHVDVRMMRHRRAPSMQHGGDADPGAQMPGIGGDGERGLGGGLEQQVINHRLFCQAMSATGAGSVKTRWK